MGLFSAGLGLILWFNYVGFADGLFGLHYLRFRLGLFMVVLVFFMFTFVLYSADLWLVWCLFDCALRFT